MTSSYLAGWFFVEPSMTPTHLNSNLDVNPIQTNSIYDVDTDTISDYLLGVFDASGTIDVSNIQCSIDSTYQNYITETMQIPHTINTDNQITFKDCNCIDFLGNLYTNSKEKLYDTDNYNQFTKLISPSPTLNINLVSPNAIFPTKKNFSDVGFDLSVISVHKVLNSTTTMYDTGIKLDIPVGYYVEIVPRSSISKSGYMLANSVGIIDCGYKGNLYVCMTKIAPEATEPELPWKCCQLIMKSQVYPTLSCNMNNDNNTSRGEGGFGSTNT